MRWQVCRSTCLCNPVHNGVNLISPTIASSPSTEGLTQLQDMKIDKAVTHIPATAAETPAQLPLVASDLPLVVNAALTVGTPAQLPLAVSDPSTVVNTALTVGTPVNVLAASTGGMTGMANVQTQITTGQLLGTVLVADMQVHLQPLHLQPLQTLLQGGDGISAGAPLFPPYY